MGASRLKPLTAKELEKLTATKPTSIKHRSLGGVPGFVLVHTPAGYTGYGLIYRAGGVRKKLTLGSTKRLTLGEARTLAGKYRASVEAGTGVPEIECVEVSSASCWRGVWLIKSGVEHPPTRPSGFPVPRGTMLVRSGNSALVWVAGNAPEVSTKGDYYQGKKSIPRPLQLIRHAGSGPLELTAHEALALTKMDWNNDALYDPVPVSIRYSQKLARTIANVPDLPRSVYPYRLFM